MRQNFEEIVKIVEKLRNNCPWDKEQTITTLRKDLESEFNEVMEAFDKVDYENLKEELGDLMWCILLISQVAKEEKLFDINEILENTKKKMIRRHPHVFGNKKANN